MHGPFPRPFALTRSPRRAGRGAGERRQSTFESAQDFVSRAHDAPVQRGLLASQSRRRQLVLVVDGGSVGNSTTLSVSANGGTAIADASGGNYNLAFVS